MNFNNNNEVFVASGVILDSTAKNEYHENLLHLPTHHGVIKLDIDGWLQPIEAHYLYKCAYESANILELGSYHGLSTSIIAQAKIDSGNTGTITTVDVFSKNIEKTN